MADKSFILRLELEGGQIVLRGLDSVGDAGDRAGKRIQQAFDREATPAQRAYNQTIEEGGALIQGYASRLGPLGNIPTSLGPKGLIAAAGIGAITAAGVALSGQVQQLVGNLDQVQDAADKLGISAEKIQALRLSARDAGFEPTQADSAIQSIRDMRLQALSGVRGSERAKGLLSALGIDDTELRSLERTEDLLRRIGEAASKMGNEGQAAGILLKAGLDSVATALIDNGGRLDDLTAQYKASGQVFDEELVKRAADLQQRWDEMSTRISVTLGDAFVTLGERATPPLEKIAGLVGVIMNGVALLDRLGLTSQILAQAGGFGDIAGLIQGAQVNTGGKFAVATVEQSVVSRVLQAMRSTLPEKPGTLDRFKGSDIPTTGWSFNRDAIDTARDQDRAADTAAKEAAALAALEQARRNWRDDPIIKAEDLAALERVGDSVGKSITEATDHLGKEFSKAFEDRERVVEFFAQPLAAAIRSGDVVGAAESLADAFANVLAQRLAYGFLDAVIPQGGGWLGNVLGGGDLFSWGGGNSVTAGVGNAVLAGARAGGGPVDAGKTYLIGERGPELLTMGGAGHVTSNEALTAHLREVSAQSSLQRSMPAVVVAVADREAAASRNPAPPVVQIINQTSQPVQAETRSFLDPQGRMNIKTILKPMVEAQVKETVGSGRANREMATQFGIGPKPARRG